MKLKIRWYQITLDFDGKHWHVDAPTSEWEVMLDRATQRERAGAEDPVDAALRVARNFLSDSMQVLRCVHRPVHGFAPRRLRAAKAAA